MCSPVVPYVVMAAAAAVQAYGQNQASNAEAADAEQNAEIGRLRAGDALARGAAAGGQIRAEGSQQVGAQRVATAAGGVSVRSGTPVNLFSSTRATAELDAQTARSNATREAWGHQVGEAQDRTKAAVARRSSVLGPLSTLVGSGAQMGSMYAGRKGK